MIIAGPKKQIEPVFVRYYDEVSKKFNKNFANDLNNSNHSDNSNNLNITNFDPTLGNFPLVQFQNTSNGFYKSRPMYIIRMKSTTMSRLRFVFPVDTTEFYFNNVEAMNCINYLFSNSITSRLFFILRTRYGLIYDVKGFNEMSRRISKIWVYPNRYMTDCKNIRRVLLLVYKQLNILQQAGLDQQRTEIKFKNAILTKLLMEIKQFKTTAILKIIEMDLYFNIKFTAICSDFKCTAH